MVFFRKINKNRFVGMAIIDICSIPMEDSTSSDDIIHGFEQIVRELQIQYLNDNVAIELFWLTQKVEGQVFRSSINFYLLIRVLDNDKDIIDKKITGFEKKILTNLGIMGYAAKSIDDYAEFEKSICTVNRTKTIAIKKKAIYTYSIGAQMPIVYVGYTASKKYDNFDSIVSLMSQYEGCAISFQIMPIISKWEESGGINNLAFEYNAIAQRSMVNGADPVMSDAVQAINYYQKKTTSGFYAYNIVVYGDDLSCDAISSRLVNGLNGEERTGIDAEYEQVDLKPMKIDLHKDIWVSPWNFNMYIMHYIQKNGYINLADRVAKKLSILMTHEEINTYFHVPMSNKNNLAIKSDFYSVVREQFDEGITSNYDIFFGKIKSFNNSDLGIGCTLDALTRHALVVGMPGTGKTTFFLGLLLQFNKLGIPFLAIEPTKNEYRTILSNIKDTQIFTPGKNKLSPFIINPFIPPKGVAVEQYIPALMSAFKAAISMDTPLDVIFLSAIRTCYTEYGWKDYSMCDDSDVKSFGMYEFILVFKRIVKESNYSRDVRGNIESGGTFRLMNLLEENANIYDTVNTIPIDDLLSKPTIIELNAIHDLEQKALLMAFILTNICVYTKLVQVGDGQLKNAILIDEAHVLLGSSASSNEANAQKATVESLQSMIAEIRSYGTSIIIADQSPEKVSREVVANTDIKMVFRLTEEKEKKIIESSTNMSPEMYNYLSSLKRGEAYVYCSKTKEPQLIVTNDVRKENNLCVTIDDDEIQGNITYWENKKEMLRPYIECSYCTTCNSDCDFSIRAKAAYYALLVYNKVKNKIENKQILAKYVVSMNDIMKDIVDVDEGDFERLINCICLKFIRKVQLEKDIRLTAAEIKSLIQKKEEKSYGG